MRYFETQSGDYFAIENTVCFKVHDLGTAYINRYKLEVMTHVWNDVCGLYDTLEEVNQAKLAVILWAINDTRSLFSFKQDKDCAPWEALAKVGPDVLSRLTDAEITIAKIGLCSPAPQEAADIYENKYGSVKEHAWKVVK